MCRPKALPAQRRLEFPAGAVALSEVEEELTKFLVGISKARDLRDLLETINDLLVMMRKEEGILKNPDKIWNLFAMKNDLNRARAEQAALRQLHGLDKHRRKDRLSLFFQVAKQMLTDLMYNLITVKGIAAEGVSYPEEIRPCATHPACLPEGVASPYCFQLIVAHCQEKPNHLFAACVTGPPHLHLKGICIRRKRNRKTNFKIMPFRSIYRNQKQ